LYASLQSSVARELLERVAGPEEMRNTIGVPDTSYVISNGQVNSKSQGSVALLRLMNFPWPILAFLVNLIPLFIRDTAYDKFAAHRFNLFGGTEQIQAFPPESENLFLDKDEGIHMCPLPRKKEQ